VRRGAARFLKLRATTSLYHFALQLRVNTELVAAYFAGCLAMMRSLILS
jgi:hypothetical protein